eukprot:gb/GECH01002329.1/.p1 GENE.gb/GECH01002329.1/~~gb/GECH01002329.1/.p1  ORF type:complete len:628 (+),score=123.66 gb/GECH01002329.1/:1-1884(+)
MNSTNSPPVSPSSEQNVTNLYNTAFNSPVTSNQYPRTYQRYRLTPDESFDTNEEYIEQLKEDRNSMENVQFPHQREEIFSTEKTYTPTRSYSSGTPIPRISMNFSTTPMNDDRRSDEEPISAYECTDYPSSTYPSSFYANHPTTSRSLDAEFDNLFETVSRFFSPQVPLFDASDKRNNSTKAIQSSEDSTPIETMHYSQLDQFMQSKEDNNLFENNSSFEDSPREISSSTSIEQGNRHIQQISHAFDNLVQERDWLAEEIGTVHQQQDDVEAEMKQVENMMNDLRERQKMLKKKQQEFNHRDSFLKSKLSRVDSKLNHMSEKIQNFENSVLSDISESEVLSSHQKYRYEFSRQSLFGHKGAIRCVAVDEDTGLVASGSTDTNVCLWDVESGKHKHTFKAHKGWIHTLTCSNGLIISGSGDRTLKMLNARTLEQELSLTGHSAGISCVYADQSAIISGSLNGEMRQWDKHSGQCVNEFSNSKYILCLAGDSSFFLASGGYAGVYIWDLRSGRCTQTLSSLRDVQCMWMDEDLIYTGESSGRVTVFDRRTWRPCHTLEIGARVTALSVYDHSMMVAANQKPLTFYDVHRWNATRRLKGSETNITDFSCSLKLSTLVSGSSDGVVKLWDL